MWFWRAPVSKRIRSAKKWPNRSFIASAMRGSLAFTCVVILHRKILMTRQGFSSLSIHQEEELRYDKKKQQQQLQETTVEPR